MGSFLTSRGTFGRNCVIQGHFEIINLCTFDFISAELMKSKFIRRPSVRPSVVCVAIVSEPNARISFKILGIASPRPYARPFFDF